MLFLFNFTISSAIIDWLYLPPWTNIFVKMEMSLKKGMYSITTIAIIGIPLNMLYTILFVTFSFLKQYNKTNGTINIVANFIAIEKAKNTVVSNIFFFLTKKYNANNKNRIK